MRYLSVCSGIEAATVAWHQLGWLPVAVSEIEPFPSAVLAHHYPTVPNLGDMTKFKDWPDADIDLLVGGTPCQSFSVAGLRKGLDDPRGSLMLTYLAIARRYSPEWLVWENVPGVLSADGGRAFGSLLGGLAELGYGFAYRVLDAQYFGLAQRRQRVFVVGHSRDWRRAAAVLFERESLSGHPAPRREAGQVAPTVPSRSTAGGGLGTDFDCDGGLIPQVSPTIGGCSNGGGANGPGRDVDSCESLIPMTLAIRGRGDSHDLEYRQDGTANAILTPNGGRGGIVVGAIAFTVKDYGADAGDLAPTLRAGGHDGSHANGGVMPAVAFDTTQITSSTNRSNPQPGDPCHPLAAGAHPPAVAFADVADPVAANQARAYTREGTHNFRLSNVAITPMQVRRLTPRECERLQGFPDDYTLIPYRGKPAADGPRYKALGNSMAVPCMAWIGRRIQMVSEIEAAA
jgi:DNA (cytosine-5)-methyltransferase 1